MHTQLFARREVLELFAAVDATKLEVVSPGEHTGQNVSNAVWSFGKANVQCPGIVAALQVSGGGARLIGVERTLAAWALPLPPTLPLM